MSRSKLRTEGASDLVRSSKQQKFSACVCLHLDWSCPNSELRSSEQWKFSDHFCLRYYFLVIGLMLPKFRTERSARSFRTDCLVELRVANGQWVSIAKCSSCGHVMCFKFRFCFGSELIYLFKLIHYIIVWFDASRTCIHFNTLASLAHSQLYTF